MITTYFLLYYRSENDGLRAELSALLDISDKGVVRDWSERILLPPRTFGPTEVLPRDAGGEDEIDFRITAR